MFVYHSGTRCSNGKNVSPEDSVVWETPAKRGKKEGKGRMKKGRRRGRGEGTGRVKQGRGIGRVEGIEIWGKGG